MRRRRSARRPTDAPEQHAGASVGMPEIEGYAGGAVIGHGATATVYRASQDGYDRAVAVKVLNVDVSDRRAQKRFQRERAVNGRLSDHPNVVTVLDSGFVGGRHPYLVMELFEQGSLADRLGADGPFDVSTTLHVGIRVAGALESAHRLGILHRDVKPQNVLMSRYGEPALADFGIAQILQMEHSLTAALTPVHAPPEVLEGEEPTPSADVYALASTLHTMLSGAPPFLGPPGEGMLAQLLRITTSEPPTIGRNDLPIGLVEVIDRALAKQPDDRYASSAEFGRELQRIQRDAGFEVSSLPVELEPIEPPPVHPSTARADVSPPASTVTVVPDQSVAPPSSFAPPVSEPGPARAVSARDGIDDVVDGRPVDAPTVIGSRPAPAFPEEPPKRRRWVIPSIVVGALALGGAVTWLATSVLGGGEDDDPSADAPSATVPANLDPAALAPIGLEASVDGDAVLLVWRDRTGGEAPQIVSTYVVGSEPESRPVDPGVSTSLIMDVGSDTPACFVVSAVLALGDETTSAVTADSEPVCINNATAQAVDG